MVPIRGCANGEFHISFTKFFQELTEGHFSFWQIQNKAFTVDRHGISSTIDRKSLCICLFVTIGRTARFHVYECKAYAVAFQNFRWDSEQNAQIIQAIIRTWAFYPFLTNVLLRKKHLWAICWDEGEHFKILRQHVCL